MPEASPGGPAVSFCIVNHDSRELLLACLESVFTHPPSEDYEVLVLDNCSTDGSAEAVRERYGDRVTVIQPPQRQGKADNDSLLMSRARGRYFLLLNDDSELTAGAADALVAALEATPRAAVAGAQLLNTEGVPQPCAWRFPGVDTALAGALFLHRFYTVQSKGDSSREVDWVQSAGMLVRASAFEQVGPLDSRFFVYSDEVDWQKRAHDLGWRVLFVPGARIYHHEQLSHGDAAERRIVEFSRNRDLYMRKHHGKPAALAVRVLTAWAYVVRALAATVLPGRDAKRFRKHAYYSLFPSRGRGLAPSTPEAP